MGSCGISVFTNSSRLDMCLASWSPGHVAMLTLDLDWHKRLRPPSAVPHYSASKTRTSTTNNQINFCSSITEAPALVDLLLLPA